MDMSHIYMDAWLFLSIYAWICYVQYICICYLQISRGCHRVESLTRIWIHWNCNPDVISTYTGDVLSHIHAYDTCSYTRLGDFHIYMYLVCSTCIWHFPIYMAFSFHIYMYLVLRHIQAYVTITHTWWCYFHIHVEMFLWYTDGDVTSPYTWPFHFHIYIETTFEQSYDALWYFFLKGACEKNHDHEYLKIKHMYLENILMDTYKWQYIHVVIYVYMK